MNAIRLAIAGFGKIARDQHVPALAKTAGVVLTAIADPVAAPVGIEHFATFDELLKRRPEIDAVALCTPPQARRALAAAAIAAGKHVLLEKPPAATVSELSPVVEVARASGRTLFTAWHSRFTPAVEPARTFLAGHAKIGRAHV